MREKTEHEKAEADYRRASEACAMVEGLRFGWGVGVYIALMATTIGWVATGSLGVDNPFMFAIGCGMASMLLSGPVAEAVLRRRLR